VRNICDRAAWLDHGDLVKEGEAHDVVTAYLESVRDDRRAREHQTGSVVTPEEAIGDWHIREVRIVDETGRDVDVVGSGDKVTIRVELEVARDEEVALALGLYRTDGVHVAGPVHRFRTRGVGLRTVDYTVPHMVLASGTYDVSARLLDDHLQRTHAVRRRAARIDVNSDQHADIGGLVALGGAWSVSTEGSAP
jgi:lipopolysaccharide transport system ATP-binding protein